MDWGHLTSVGENRAKGIIQRILHSSCLKAAAFFAHPWMSAWFWPRPKSWVSDHSRLRRTVQTGTSNPTQLALKWPLNSPSSWACCLKLFLENRSIEEQCNFCSGFEFGFYHIIFLKEFSSPSIPSLRTDCLTFLRGNETQLAGECVYLRVSRA